MMTGFGCAEYHIRLLSCNLMPVVLGETFFADRTTAVTLQPDLKAGDAEQMTAFRQSPNVEFTLTDDAEPFRIQLLLP